MNLYIYILVLGKTKKNGHISIFIESRIIFFLDCVKVDMTVLFSPHDMSVELPYQAMFINLKITKLLSEHKTL